MLIGAIIGIVIGSAIAALITGLILMLIAPFTAGRKPSYGQAWVTMFLAHAVSGAIRVLLGLIAAEDLTETPMWASGVGWIAGFAILTYFIASKLETSLGPAALTALVMTAIGLAFAIALGVLMAVLLAGAAAAGG